MDCRDDSDEEECRILDLKRSYSKFSPPVQRQEGSQVLEAVMVNISFTLQDISLIREARNEISLKFSTTIAWIESRATYHNLKVDQAENVLKKEDEDKLWIPKLIFENSKEKHDTTRNLEGTQFFIRREGNASWSKSDIAEDILLFEGAENPIVMVFSTTLVFNCFYDLELFPFDTQVKRYKGAKVERYRYRYRYTNTLAYRITLLCSKHFSN